MWALSHSNAVCGWAGSSTQTAPTLFPAMTPSMIRVKYAPWNKGRTLVDSLGLKIATTWLFPLLTLFKALTHRVEFSIIVCRETIPAANRSDPLSLHYSMSVKIGHLYNCHLAQGKRTMLTSA